MQQAKNWVCHASGVCDILLLLLKRYIVGQYVTIHDDVISHINITDVEASDGGTYACQASNSVGSVQHTARLNVYGKLATERLASSSSLKLQ